MPHDQCTAPPASRLAAIAEYEVDLLPIVPGVIRLGARQGWTHGGRAAKRAAKQAFYQRSFEPELFGVCDVLP